MTFRELAIIHLMNRGMLEVEANKVVSLATESLHYQDMNGRWDDDAGGYPVAMVTGVVLMVLDEAKAWVEQNKPNAWYKPMLQV